MTTGKGLRDHDTFPLRSLGFAGILTLALFTVGVLNSHRAYLGFSDLVNTELRMSQLNGTIAHLDEILTSSARMAAATGDVAWEERYAAYDPLLDAAIKEMTAIQPDAVGADATAKTHEANDKLVVMEKAAFALARKGETGAATALLFSPEYQREKKVYATGMSSNVAAIKLRIEQRLSSHRQQMILTVVIGLVITGLLTVCWISVVRVVVRHLENQEKSRAALQEANATLEQRVGERTRLLHDANANLSKEMRERKSIEVELRHAQKLEAVGRLAAGIAHEINTPIQYVSDNIHFLGTAFSEMSGLVGKYRSACHLPHAEGGLAIALLESLDQQERDADLDYLIENIPSALTSSQDGIGRVAVIVRSMKEFAHPGKGEKSGIDVNEAIQSTLAVSRNEYKYVAELETELGEIPMINCHGGEINQVILNILINATHAISDRVRDTGALGMIRVKTRCEEGSVVIEISDDGDGIPVAIRDKVFDPFFTTKEVGRGTGQGLAIARSVVVDKHGGSLTFVSEVGKGTTFFIRLPIDGGNMT